MISITLSTPLDFSFLEAVSAHGWRRLAPFVWDDEAAALLRAHEFAPGRAGWLRIAANGDEQTLSVESSVEASGDEIAALARRMLQLDLPMDRFHAFCVQYPELSHIPGLRQGRLLVGPTLWEDVVKVIATTNTTWSQTIGMTARLVETFGSPLAPSAHASLDTSPTGREGKALGNLPLDARTFPRPEQIASVPLEEFGAKARMGYRNAAVHRIAGDIAEGRLDLESWRDPSIPSPELYKKLLSLPGIGPYAASCLMIYLGRYDRVNVDSWARMMVGKELGRKVTDKEVHAFFEPYGDWKALVYHFYKWKEEEPVY